ncbi:MAG: translational repressor RegA [Bacteroidota bacterium]|jgi:hypothetical protein
MSAIDSLIEIKLFTPEDFLKVKETLTRIGVSSKKEKTLYQSCHILHKRDKDTKESRYFIVHFKELFKLDGKPTDFTQDDIARRNTIVNILSEWKLLSIVDKSKCESPICPVSTIQIVPFKEKVNWKLEAKYNIGNSRNKK